MLGGLVAGEGCFSVTRQRQGFRDGSPRRRFVFSLSMATRDRALLEQLQEFLGEGSVCDRPGRNGWQPESTFAITSRRAHQVATIPFAAEFLLPSAKRRQFETWRAAFNAYEAEHPTLTGTGRSPCPFDTASSRCAGKTSAAGAVRVPPASVLAQFLGGFVAAEGTFTTDGNRRFTFAIALGSADQGMCAIAQDFLGVGHVYHSVRRRPTYDDEVCFKVQSLDDLVGAVVPFVDEHLPPSYKRGQYERWRASLLSYWDQRARRVRPCSVPGCEAPRRAKSLCRAHYFEAFKR